MSELLPPLILELRAKAGEVHSELKKVGTEVQDLDHKTESGMSHTQKAFHGLAGAGKAIATGVLGAGAAVAAFGLEAVKTAQVADAKLDTAVRNVGGSMDELKPRIDATDVRMRALGFTNADTNTSLAQLTTSLKSPTLAMKDMGVVADLARAKNIPLAQSALLVAKASEGQTRPLKALGIDLPVYAGGAQNVKLANMALAKAQQHVHDVLAATPGAMNPASKAHLTYQKAVGAVTLAQQKLSSVQHSGQLIMDTLKQRISGNAQAFGHTLAGQIQVAHAQMDNLGEKVGAFLIPKLVDLMNIVMGVVHWFGQHTTTAKILAGVIGGVLVLAMAAWATELVKDTAKSIEQFGKSMAAGAEWAAEHTAMAAAFIAENVAMAASAVAAFVAENAATLGIAAAIAIVVAAIVWLATHWKEAWGAIKTAAETVWRDVLKPVFSGIETAAEDLWNYAIKPVLQAIVDSWKLSWAFVKAVYEDVILPVGRAIGDVFSAIGTAVAFVYNHVIHPVISAVGTAVRWLYNNVIEPVGQAIEDVWSAIGTGLEWVWNNIIKPIIDTITKAIDTVKNALSDVANAVSLSDAFDNNTVAQLKKEAAHGHAGGGYLDPGLNLVGENGPEFIVNQGGRQRVIPTTQTMRSMSSGLGAAAALTGRSGVGAGRSSGAGGAQVIELHSHLMLDGSQVHETVQRIELQKAARRGQSWPGYRRG